MNTTQVQTVDFTSADAAQAFCDSIHHTGFAVLKNHPIPSGLLKRIYGGWLEFFAGDEKFDYHFDDREVDGPQHGYFSLAVSERAVGKAEKDIKEFFHAGPGGPMPPQLADDIIEYRRVALALARTLLGWFDTTLTREQLKNPDVRLADVLDDEPSLLRILHYPPLSGKEPSGSERAAAHEDINFITILPVSEQPGLQVKNRRGEWLDLQGRSGELIINTGDMLQELTGGYLPSTTHRVVNPPIDEHNVSRISLPFFLTPALDTRLSERYTAGEYLTERLTAIDGRDAG